MKKKTCYISLPIEGRDIEEVKKEIEKHKTHLREKGFIPISPLDVEEDPTAMHEQHMGEDFKPLPKCDAIYIAPSPGVLVYVIWNLTLILARGILLENIPNATLLW